jgi:hypothetical protein
MNRLQDLILPKAFLEERAALRQAGVLVLVSWQDVSGVAMSEAEVIALTSSFHRETLLRVIGLLSVLTTNAPGQRTRDLDFHVGAAREFCPSDVADRVEDFLRSESRQIYIHDEQLLLAALLAIRYGQDGPPEALGSSSGLGQLLLGINDVLLIPEAGGSLPDDAITMLTLRRLGLFAHDQPPYVLARMFDLLVTRARRYRGTARRVDLDATFRAATAGLTFEEFLGCAVVYLANFVKITSIGDVQGVDPFAQAAAFEAQIADRDLAALARDNFTANQAWFEEALAKGSATSLSLTDFRVLMQRPIFRLADGRLVPLSMSALLNKLAIGAYWTLHAELRANGTLTDFTTMLGELFQDYATDRIRDWATGKASTLRVVDEREVLAASPRKKSQERPPFDLAIVEGDALALFEIYAGAVPYEVLTTGDVQRFQDTLTKKYVGKGQQLAGAIEGVSCGRWVIPGVDPVGIRRVFPVLVLLHPFPQFGTMADPARQPVAFGLRPFGGPLASTLVYPVQLLEAEDVEMLAPWLQHGDVSLSDLLARRMASPVTAAGSMKTFTLNYLHLAQRRNDVMGELYQVATQASLAALRSRGAVP